MASNVWGSDPEDGMYFPIHPRESNWVVWVHLRKATYGNNWNKRKKKSIVKRVMRDYEDMDLEQAQSRALECYNWLAHNRNKEYDPRFRNEWHKYQREMRDLVMYCDNIKEMMERFATPTE